jgi:hypothetical protein
MKSLPWRVVHAEPQIHRVLVYTRKSIGSIFIPQSMFIYYKNVLFFPKKSIRFYRLNLPDISSAAGPLGEEETGQANPRIL